APLARVAVAALGVSLAGMAIAYGLSYVRTLRRLAEEPDITPGVTRLRWLPRFGNSFSTAIVQFSLRTLFRSSQHRVLLAFYWGIGFALTVLLLKTPRGQQFAESAVGGWQEGSIPLLVSSIWMLGFAAAQFERERLQDTSHTVAMLAGLFITWAAVRPETVRRTHGERSEPEFEEESADRLLTLEVWDARFASRARQTSVAEGGRPRE